MTRRHLARAAVVGAVLAAVAVPSVVAAVKMPSRWDGALAACEQEDGPGPCFWDATRRGNGLGTSFVMDGRGVVYLRKETRAEMTCKDAASTADPARIPARMRDCERRADLRTMRTGA